MGVPLLIFANKQDLAVALDCGEVDLYTIIDHGYAGNRIDQDQSLDHLSLLSKIPIRPLRRPKLVDRQCQKMIIQAPIILPHNHSDDHLNAKSPTYE